MSLDRFRHDKTTETLRPAVLPDDKRVFSYPVFIGLTISVVGLFLDNYIMVVLPLIVLAVFPGLPVLFHLIYYLFVKVEILPDRLIITDYVSDRFVRFKTHQEITFSEICYINYLGKEINLLLNLRNKLKKFRIPPGETDYTKANLISRYGVPEALFEKFEKSSQKTLTDYTATGVLMKLDEIYSRYSVSKETRDNIKKALKSDSNLNFEYLKTALRNYPINSQDLESLNDEFTNIDADILAPFLLTKVNLVKYQKAEKYRHGAHVTARTDNGLVLSSQDGTKKIYFMHFHDLCERDLHQFIETVNSKQPSVKFLMTKRERERLFVK
ncbi:MAG: hypothetical protein ACYTBX_04350 [Planctomycetota bacterium]|jgi:hypothetical protein